MIEPTKEGWTAAVTEIESDERQAAAMTDDMKAHHPVEATAHSEPQGRLIHFARFFVLAFLVVWVAVKAFEATRAFGEAIAHGHM